MQTCKMPEFKLYIDAGHGTVDSNGAFDPGAVSASGLQESDVALQVSKLIADGLNGLCEVKLCRTGTTPNGIDARANEANKWGADFVLSLHANSSEISSAYGAEALIYARGGKAEKYAKVILDTLCDKCGLYNRGVKVRTDLGILSRTKAPAVLIELAFMSNPSEAVRMSANTQQAFIATSICGGLIDVLGLPVEAHTAYPIITHPDTNTFIIRTTPARFAVNWEDKRKQSVSAGRVIGGFFGTEKGGATVSGGNVCINGYTVVQAATAPTWSNLYGKPLTTLCVHDNGEAHIIKTDRLDDQIGLRCAISGAPVLINGKEVSLSKDIKAEGYFGNELYLTWHVFIGIVGKEIWIILKKTGHANAVTATTVIANALLAIIRKYVPDEDEAKITFFKCDGGGSFFAHFTEEEAAMLGISAYIGTSENRRINTSLSY